MPTGMPEPQEEDRPITYMGLRLQQHLTLLFISAVLSGVWTLILKTDFSTFFWSTFGCWVFFTMVYRPKKKEEEKS